MLRGRFLGVAQNVGDAFCFLILTVPDPDSNEAPQVLSRSVIRSRCYETGGTINPTTTEATGPTVHGNTDTVIFYRSDGRTVLSDPPTVSMTSTSSTVQQEDFHDGIQDIVSTDCDASILPRTGPTTMCSSNSDPTVSDFQERMIEVYGPAISSHVTIDANSDPNLDDSTVLQSASTQPDNLVSEERANTDVIRNNELQQSTIDENLDELVETMVAIAHENCAVPTTTEAVGDDRHSGPPAMENPNSGGPISDMQDVEEVEPQVLDDVIYQLERIAEDSSSDELFDSIVGHTWDQGRLLFNIRWKTDGTSLVPFDDVHRDYPSETAEYILANKVGTSSGNYTGGRYTRWARQYTRQYPVIVRRLVRMASGVPTVPIDNNQPLLHFVNSNPVSGQRVVRRNTVHAQQQKQAARMSGTKRKKPGRLSRPVQTKYGVTVPRNVNHAFELDDDEGGTCWADAITKEVDSLLQLDCFEFFPPDYKPSSDYQFTKLTMIFEVKQDGRRKARLVAGGHLIDPKGISSRSTVVKGISVRLLDLIAHRDNLQILCGDIGNAFITAKCLEKVYSRAGPEFREREGSIIVFRKALYGLRSSSRAFRAHFADFLKSMGFVATRYDRDVWMRARETCDGYDYLCTHVDDFKIVAKEPERWKDKISAAFLLKSIGPPSYYLGNDYNYSEQEGAWVLSCATYVKECLRKIEADLGDSNSLYRHRTPLPQESHPELDSSELLDATGVQKYQALIGMAQWACVIGRLDIGFAVSSLSRFSAAPRQGHLELAYYLFGYLKQYPNRRIVLDSRPLLIDDELLTDSFHPDFLEDYPDAKEDIAQDFPASYGTELHTTVFFDADHAHDTVTRRSISGLLVFVGSTPVIWSSKRQGCIATSTYCAEFVAMRSAVEEAISIRYMLRCLGVPVTTPTNLFGDNFGVIQSAEIPDGELKKKHIAISYHYVREAIAARIVNAHWCRSHENFADVLTKALGNNIFSDIVNDLMA